jgi:hypothetical protein
MTCWALVSLWMIPEKDLQSTTNMNQHINLASSSSEANRQCWVRGAVSPLRCLYRYRKTSGMGFYHYRNVYVHYTFTVLGVFSNAVTWRTRWSLWEFFHLQRDINILVSLYKDYFVSPSKTVYFLASIAWNLIQQWPSNWSQFHGRKE